MFVAWSWLMAVLRLEEGTIVLLLPDHHVAKTLRDECLSTLLLLLLLLLVRVIFSVWSDKAFSGKVESITMCDSGWVLFDSFPEVSILDCCEAGGTSLGTALLSSVVTVIDEEGRTAVVDLFDEVLLSLSLSLSTSMFTPDVTAD